jgi:hypothetical protein
MRPLFAPLHLLFFTETFIDHCIDTGFNERRGDSFTVTPALSIIGDHGLVAFNIDVEFLDRFLQFGEIGSSAPSVQKFTLAYLTHNSYAQQDCCTQGQ